MFYGTCKDHTVCLHPREVRLRKQTLSKQRIGLTSLPVWNKRLRRATSRFPADLILPPRDWTFAHVGPQDI